MAIAGTNSSSIVLLTGATGYIGGRLRQRLEAEGHRVRCMARHPENIEGRIGATTEVVRGDVLDAQSLTAAMRGVATAFYLVHSMSSEGSFEERDRRGALNFAAAARAAGLRRIIYVGGLGDSSLPLSPHLRSRHEVGAILRDSGVPTVELRASIVIGSGSLSFEMVRALVERLPVMITPRWVANRAQPIAIDDLLDYLEESMTIPLAESTVFEIGGPDRVSYGDIMTEYARQRGLRRWAIPVPVLTPRLSSWWLGLVTPLYARVGRKLIDSIYYPTVVRDDAARRAFRVRPIGLKEAVARALRNEDRELAVTRWSDALSSAGPTRDWGGVRFGNRLVDSRVVVVATTAAAAFAPIRRIGGAAGWYYADWLWTLRGLLDLVAGGVGMRRGRRDAHALIAGDVVDCWRVEEVVPDQLLRLRAEMKLPGRAWLQFDVHEDNGQSTIRQTAIFDPVGFSGLLYWYAVYPLHQLIFQRMLDGIAERAKAEAVKGCRGKGEPGAAGSSSALVPSTPIQ